MSTTPIDFSSIGGKPVQQGGLDFSSVGGKQVAPDDPTLMQRVSNGLSYIWKGLPPGMASELTQHLGNWANEKADQNRQENLAAAAKGQPTPHSEITNTALGMLGSTGKMASQVTTPQGLAVAGAAAVAPEIVGPAMIAHGGYTAAKNAPAAIQGNPDAVEASLTGLSEAAGGGALAGQAASSGLSNTLTGRAVKATAQASGLAAPDPIPSLMRAIKPTNSKTDFPQTLASAGPDLQAHAQNSGKPITNIADLVQAIPEAKKGLWQQYQAKLGPNASATIDGNDVADAMVDSIDKRTRVQNPALADRIEETAETYRKPLTLEDAEDFLQSANNELHSYYAKNKVGQQVAANDPATGHVVAEASALRSALYDKLDDLTGPGAGDLKKRYGALSDLQEEALRRKNVADRQSQIGTMASLGRIAGVSDIGKGITSADVPRVVGGVGQVLMGQRISNLNNTDWLINNAFNGPKAFSARAGAAPNVAAPSTPAPTIPPALVGRVPPGLSNADLQNWLKTQTNEK